MEEKSLTDCIFFLSSSCKNGDRCEFRHSGDALKNFTPCTFWMRGSCTNAFCRFRHPARPTAKSSSFTPAPKADPTSTSCYFYSNGGCAKGTACPFIHDPSTLLRGFDPADGTPLNKKSAAATTTTTKSSSSSTSSSTTTSSGLPKSKKFSPANTSSESDNKAAKPSILNRVGGGAKKTSAPAPVTANKKDGGLSMRDRLKSQATNDGPAPDFGVRPLGAGPKAGGATIFSKALQNATGPKKRARDDTDATAASATDESASKRQKTEEVEPAAEEYQAEEEYAEGELAEYAEGEEGEGEEYNEEEAAGDYEVPDDLDGLEGDEDVGEVPDDLNI